jgi:hypothetical protein
VTLESSTFSKVGRRVDTRDKNEEIEDREKGKKV